MSALPHVNFETASLAVPSNAASTTINSTNSATAGGLAQRFNAGANIILTGTIDASERAIAYWTCAEVDLGAVALTPLQVGVYMCVRVRVCNLLVILHFVRQPVWE